MKAVILAGGLGTRISEETRIKPKPMVEVGGWPILWHIMKLYRHYDINEFVICLGYKGYIIKEYFQNYMMHRSDVTFDMGAGQTEIHLSRNEDWRVTLVETGEKAQTGARIRKILPYVQESESFCLTYGDGISNVNIGELIKFHKSHGKTATLTAVTPPGRFGALDFHPENPKAVQKFMEKPAGDGGLINGGFFVLNSNVQKFLTNDDKLVWEHEPLRNLASAGELMAYRHRGFWQPMDTLRDLAELESLWESGSPPWKLWQ